MIRTIRAALLAAACATSAGAQKAPPPLPLSAYVDSAALHQALRATLPPPPLTRGDQLLFQVSYGDSGELEEVESLACRPPAGEYQKEMAALLRAHVRTQMEKRERDGTILRVQGGPRPRLEIARDVREDRPELIERDELRRRMDAIARRIVTQHPELKRHMSEGVLRMRIDESGAVVAPTLIQRSNLDAINAGYLEVANSMRFRPAMINRCPVMVLVELPVTFYFPR